jgi:hypothetical protein
MTLCEIYSLSDPLTNEIKYIGKANNTQERLKSHLRDAKRRATPVYQWINELKDKGLTPIAKIICITQDWQNEEKKQIIIHRDMGCNLLNISSGGKDIYCSTEQRKINGSKTFNKIRMSKDFILKRQIALTIKVLKKKCDIMEYNRFVLKMKGKFLFDKNLSKFMSKYKLLNLYREEINY